MSQITAHKRINDDLFNPVLSRNARPENVLQVSSVHHALGLRHPVNFNKLSLLEEDGGSRCKFATFE
jgi:hypothetical protein